MVFVKLSSEKAKAFITLQKLKKQPASSERAASILSQRNILSTRESASVPAESTTLYLRTVHGHFEKNSNVRAVALYGRFDVGADPDIFFEPFTIWFCLGLYSFLTKAQLASTFGISEQNVDDSTMTGCDLIFPSYLEEFEYDFGIDDFPIADLGLSNTESVWESDAFPFPSHNSPYESTRGGKMNFVTIEGGILLDSLQGDLQDRIVFDNYLEQEVKYSSGWLIANFVVFIILILSLLYYSVKGRY
jgi:hypothetical protein